MLQARSPGVYAYFRQTKIMMLPSRKTLRTYNGKSTGDVGITEPVRQRLKMERENLFENERRISLEVDEMAIGPKSTLVKQWMAGEEHSGGILKNIKKPFWQIVS